ncbi:MAG: ABC transporter permease [Actinobacteria bacterium]|nr:ABC transporter permease [Actinomycetota bacterium]
MNIGNLIYQSIHSIWGNKIRSGLTILGIIIGVAAVIALIGLGKGLQADVQSRLGALDASAITVRSQDPERPQFDRQAMGRGVMMFGEQADNALTVDDYQAIRQIEDVAAASPEAGKQIGVDIIKDAQTVSGYQVTGIDWQYLELKKITVVEGASLTEQQIESSESVALIGKGAAKELFPDDNTFVGKTIYIDNEAFEIVGVIEGPETDAANMPIRIRSTDPSDSIYIGYKRWLELAEEEKLPTIVLTAIDEKSVAAVASAIETLLLEAHNIDDRDKADFGLMVNQDILNTITGTASSFAVTLAWIAAISLIVGGIGIMNIMLVTVTERTREIGLRRAVGAKTRHILVQFLTESVLLTLIGGALNVVLAILFGQYIGEIVNFGSGGRGFGRNASEVKPLIDFPTIALAAGISVVVGIVFGLFPAIKAARLDPVEALRYE